MTNFGLIGYGYWGPNIAKSLAKIGDINLISICDLDNNRLKEAKLLYPQTELIKNPDQFFKNSNIDAVIIATPANTHFELSVIALKNRKHILVEKPLTLSSQQAIKLKGLNERIKKIVMVGHTFEYNPTVLKMKKIIKHNNFGKIYYIYSTRVNLGQIRGDVNALWNLAPHDISILNFLLDATPIEVKATGASFLQKDIEDVVFALLKYHDNILAEIHVSWLDPIKERKMTIVGSKKMLIFDDLDNEMPLKIYDKRVDTGEVAKGQSSEYKLKLHSGDIHIPQIEIKEPLLEELRHFFNCIKINRQPLTGLTNGLNVVRVLEACQESIRGKNSWVKI